MKKIVLLFALLLAHPLAGFHVGVGYSWNTIDETFNSTIQTNANKGGQDRYETSMNRFAPVVQVGHQFPFRKDWAAGISAQWKFLNYKTPNVNSSRGQILPNATFSSVNIFGADVDRDFTSKTLLNNEVMLLGYIGKQIVRGYAYLGVGPVFFTASNSVYVSSVHVPNGGDHLISTSVTSHQTMWGGAAQIGYQYCLNANSFINIGYTYLQSRKCHFDNSANAAILNGAFLPGATTLFLKRTIICSTQAFSFSMNLAF
jgi:outer membrane protein W